MSPVLSSLWWLRYSTLILAAAGFLPGSHAAAGPARSEDGFDPSRRYELGELVGLALGNNPSTRAAWFQARAASASIGEAKASYYPKLLARFDGGSDQWYTPAANGPDNFRRVQATTTLALEYLLLDFGRRDADVQRTVAAFDAAGFAFERKLQETVFAVQRHFFSHEAAVWRQKAAGIGLQAARTLAETVEKEVKNGLSATPELLRARKRVLEAGYEVEAAESAVRIALGDLCVAAGLPANAPLQVRQSDVPPLTKQLRGEVDRLIACSLKIRPDLAARAAEVRASEAATKRAGADFYPVVRLEGSYAYSQFGYGARDGKMDGTYQEGLNGYGAFLVGSWDLFDGFERVSRLTRRREEEKAAREKFNADRLAATRDVWSAYSENLSAARRVEYAEGFVASANESFEAISAALKSGLADINEFAEAESMASLARAELASAVAGYSTTLSALALAVGSFQPSPEPAAAMRKPASQRAR